MPEQLDLELLRKMLNMTSADNDNVALVAIRKANEALARAGETWESLLAGKIKIVEDPFKSMPGFAPQPKPSRAPTAAPRPAPSPAPPPPNAPPGWQPGFSQNPGIGDLAFHNGVAFIFDGVRWSTQPRQKAQQPKPKPDPFANMRPLTGNTFPVKDELKKLGAKWDPARKLWMVPNQHYDEAVKLVLSAGPKIRSTFAGDTKLTDFA